jgi:nascent polypeptide-associated complex subunit beta
MNSEKLARLQAQARIGGKGTARRKYKAVRTNTSSDSGKVLTTLRRMGGNPITEIEEVNMFRDDGNVIHFAKPQGMSFQRVVGSPFIPSAIGMKYTNIVVA